MRPKMQIEMVEQVISVLLILQNTFWIYLFIILLNTKARVYILLHFNPTGKSVWFVCINADREKANPEPHY